MRSHLNTNTIILLFFCSIICNSCIKKEIPILSTSEITNITATSAACGGSIIDEGSGTVLSRGVCWSTSTTPTIADTKTQDGGGSGTFTSNISGLNAATTYYVKAYAINSIGTGYGMTMSFTTLGQAPLSNNSAATNLTTTSATLNGTVNANYLSTTVTFEYGTNSEYGQSVTATQSPVTGNATTNVSADIAGLTVATKYHYRITAVNSLGTSYGEDLTFTTLGQVPTVITTGATRITSTAALLKGSVNANYLSTVVNFEFGTTPVYGQLITASQSPATGNATTNVSADITGLTPGTTYHFRVIASNSIGTSYGTDMSFVAPQISVDYDGNTYNSVIIGNQIWMAENLKTTRYSDGSNIPFISTDSEWNLLGTNQNNKAYSWYNNDISNKDIYGALYTWGAAMNGAGSSTSAPSGVQGVCPTGWHLPSLNEWDSLSTFLNGDGGKLKEVGTIHWQPPNERATNETGFTGLPAGQRFIDGASVNFGSTTAFWSSTEWSPSWGWYRGLSYINNFIDRSSYYKILGQSVRCIKD